jgi:hypothetical protein
MKAQKNYIPYLAKSPLSVILTILIALFAVALIVLLVTKVKINEAKITSFTVKDQNFFVHGKNLGRVLVWGVPTGKDLTPDDYLQITTMLRTEDEDGEQVWTAHIPVTPLILNQVFVEGYDTKGKAIGSTTLPYTGPTEINAALWSGTSTKSN